VDVRRVLESMGLRQSDMRIVGSIAIGCLLSLAAFGVLAPTTMTWLYGLDGLLHADDLIGAAAFGPLVVFLLSGAALWFLATRIIEQRWPWPIGPRIRRQRPGGRVVLPNLLALAISMLGVRVVLPYLPTASGLYIVDGADETWLRVAAPVDWAIALVAGILLYEVGFIVGVLIVAAWRGMRPPALPIEAEAGLS
jgi:hypothetical protein